MTEHIKYCGVERPYREWAKRFGMTRMSGSPFTNNQRETEEQFKERVRAFLERREKGLKTQPWRKESCEHL